MKILKGERFAGFAPIEGVVSFVNENAIKKEDILIITQTEYGYTLFYYVEE